MLINMKLKRLSCAVVSLATMCTISSVSLAQSPNVDPEGSLVYALPSTSVRLEVTAVQKRYYAGPYAKYARKYLGTDVPQADRTTFEVASVKMLPCVQADLAKRYVVAPGSGMPAFLTLTAQGLVSVAQAAAEETVWRFPAAGKADFSGKGLTSNLTSEAATLYRNVKSESAFDKMAVQQEMVVQKSPEARAKEAADMIFMLRDKRIQIVTGDTDATFSGEALSAAVAEIARLEQEYMTLFAGYTECEEQTMNFDVVPSADNVKQVYVAFRLSDTKGLVPSDDLSGKPYLLEFAVGQMEQVQAKPVSSKGPVAYYRIPATCIVKLSDGVDVLLQSAMPVYQLGIESTFPLYLK